MKNFTKNLKKQTISLLLTFMLILTSFVSLLSFVDFSKKEVFAETFGYDTISISNSNFNSNSSTDLSEPNSFTAVGTKGSTISGVIDVDPTNFNDNKEEYKLNFNPSKPNVSDDNKILMINNGTILSSYGYESSTFTLEKNRYYMISVYVFTQFDKNDEGDATDVLSSTASLYLSSTTLDKMEESKIENISTRGVWQEYRFYVQTNDESLTTKLVLYIGSNGSFKSAGAVFFDNINAYSLTEKQYDDEMNSRPKNSKTILLLNKDVSTSNGISNGDFELNDKADFTQETSTGSSSVNNVAKVVGIGEGYFDSDDSLVDTDPTNANRSNNNKAFLINNNSKGKITFVSNNILIERHKLYKLTLDVKTSNFANGGAIIELNQQNPYSSEFTFTPESKNFTSVSTSSQTNDLSNDWITYSFFITGNAFKDSYAKLTIGLDENAVGYAFFDNIKLFEITSDEFENNSSNSNCVEADFTGITDTDDSIANSSFNNIYFASTNESSPYSAEDWTYNKDTNSNNYNGIIDEYLDHQNVYVLANTEMGYQSVTSSDFTDNLTASTLDETKYYKLTFDLNTTNILYFGANATVKNSNGDILAKLNKINTNNAWKTITFLFKTSTSDVTANITISLGTSTNYEKGYAYIDNFMIEESTETEFNDAVSSEILSKTDLSKVDLTLKGENAVSNIYSADNFTGTKNSTLPADVDAGIVDINHYPLDASSENDYVLMIHNKQDAYYTLKSNAFSLTSGNYYKITARVRTINLKQDDANKQFDEENNAYKFGAKISLNGISAETEIIEENNEFTTYTFFVSATTDTNIYFELSLGSENAICSGYALFDNLSVTQISDDDFKTAEDNFDEDDKTTILIGTTSGNEEDDDESSDSSSAVNFDWLVVPSLIVAIALLIAMVGLLIRKLNIKLPVKAGVKDYDRAKTLVKEHEKREKMIAREKRLQLLREKLAELENEIQQNQIEYKNSKSLKEEIKIEHEKVEQQIKEKYVDTTSVEAQNEERKLKLEAKAKVKQARKERFEARRQELLVKFEEIEREIEAILEEERLLVEQWKAYKKEQKALKKANKLNKQNNKKK